MLKTASALLLVLSFSRGLLPAFGQEEASTAANIPNRQLISYVIPQGFAQTYFQHPNSSSLLQLRVSIRNEQAYLVPVPSGELISQHDVRIFQDKEEIHDTLKRAQDAARVQFSDILPARKETAEPIRKRNKGTVLHAAEGLASQVNPASTEPPEKAAAATSASWENEALQRPAPTAASTPPRRQKGSAAALKQAQRRLAVAQEKTRKETKNDIARLIGLEPDFDQISFPSNSRKVEIDDRIEYLQTLGDLSVELLRQQSKFRDSIKSSRNLKDEQEASQDNTRIHAIATVIKAKTIYFQTIIKTFKVLAQKNRQEPNSVYAIWVETKKFIESAWLQMPQTPSEVAKLWEIISTHMHKFLPKDYNLRKIIPKPGSLKTK